MADNQFSLKGRGLAAGPVKHEARQWTPEEQAEKLAGYMEVPRKHWPFIEYGANIRYYTREEDGSEKFRYGGFVSVNQAQASVGSGLDNRVIRLSSGFGKDSSQWSLNFENTTRIFIRPNACSLILADNIRGLSTSIDTNLQKIASFIKKLDERIAALEQRR